MRVAVKIAAGICGMNSEIELRGSMEGDYQILLSSDCQLVQSLAPYLEEADPLMAAAGRFSKNPVFQGAEACGLHAACPVPTGIIKAYEAFCQLALPGDVTITMEKQD
ncbi:MAG: hypothetical protein GX855_04805 [Firmicutes bacterium]|jgi:hypothetical protein|nr:hypothetical protein [Bacillota bacterium]